MRKFAKGFTLAEVLISLTVIGILAAITLPALNNSVQQHQIGPRVAKALNTLETANKLAIQEQSTPSLGSLCDGTTKYPSCIRQYLSFTNSTDTVLETKDGIIYSYSTAGTNNNAPTQYNGRYYVVNVDINGRKKPNVSSIDQFQFYVDKNGTVIPYGGNQYKTYTAAAANLWTAGCLNDPKKVPVTPLTCAGAIVDNGFKVNYSVNSIVGRGTLFTP